VGKKADILVFAPEEIKATATYENPFQLAQGINDIVVNGKLAINQGTILPEKQGRMLRRM
ncbi:MAG: N-acyl-D-amino acid deacylase, partial [Rufibacter sp.]